MSVLEQEESALLRQSTLDAVGVQDGDCAGRDCDSVDRRRCRRCRLRARSLLCVFLEATDLERLGRERLLLLALVRSGPLHKLMLGLGLGLGLGPPGTLGQ